MTDWSSGESRAERAGRRVAVVLLVIVSAIIAAIVCWPGPPAENAQHGLAELLSRAHRTGLPHWISFDLVENLSNVVMFLPLGLLGALALRRRPWLAVVAGALASCCIELTQLLLLPNRVASLQDVASNSIGALIGFLIVLPSLNRRYRRQRRTVLGRRGAADPVRVPAADLLVPAEAH